MSETVTYAGRDLEAMSFAENYHRWILQIFKPYLGQRLVEIGAGTGSFSELLLEQHPKELTLVEPSSEMYGLLLERMAERPERRQIKTYNAMFRQVASQLQTTTPDSIIYVNVLEHIGDDALELQAIHRTLGDNGRLFIFVPAMPRLYGSFDEQIGHFRRYTKSELESKCSQAGFKIIDTKYFDCAGIVPWWIKYRVFKSSSMEPGAVRFYDRFVVPASKAFESVFSPPVGKNIILIAEKI